jgi:hypothetical protein
MLAGVIVYVEGEHFAAKNYRGADVHMDIRRLPDEYQVKIKSEKKGKKWLKKRKH